MENYDVLEKAVILLYVWILGNLKEIYTICYDALSDT